MKIVKSLVLLANAVTALSLGACSQNKGAAATTTSAQLTQVVQQQIAAGEASFAFETLVGVFFGVGALVSLEMFQSGEGSLAGVANVQARLVRLGRREIGWRLSAGSDCARWNEKSASQAGG